MNLISFYGKVTTYWVAMKWKVIDVVYLDFGKAFDSISHSILPKKLMACLCKLCWIKNGWVVAGPKKIVNRVKSSWWPVRSSFTQKLQPVLLNIFSNDLDERTECTFVKFTDDTTLGMSVDLDGRRGLVRSMGWGQLNEFQQGWVLGSALRAQQPHKTLQTGRVVGELPSRKGSWD